MIHAAEAMFAGYSKIASRAHLAQRVSASLSVSDRCNALIAFYRAAKPAIMADAHGYGIDPYEVDWSVIFTPIEALMWHDIRAAGMVMYPQLPVGPFFVDFGNPHFKLAIECDGKEFHLDRAKDIERDRVLAKRGWRVFRIAGKDCFTNYEDMDAQIGPAELLIRQIKVLIEDMRAAAKRAAATTGATA